MNAASAARGRLSPVSALVALTALVAATTFLLSYAGLYAYGRDVVGLPPALAILVPVGIDGLTVAGLLATVSLRESRLGVRAYCWCVFLGAAAASVAGNAAHARQMGLTAAGQIGAAGWPALLTAATHLLIVVARHAPAPDVGPALATQTEASGQPPVPVKAAEPDRPGIAEQQQRPQSHSAGRKPPSAGEGDRRALRELALARHAAGIPVSAVALEVGVPRSTLRRWISAATKEAA